MQSLALSRLRAPGLSIPKLLAVWQSRRMTRLALQKLDADACRDIGISLADARIEYGKPFWKA